MSDSSHATVVPDALRAQIQDDLCRALSEQACTHHPLNPAGKAQVYDVGYAGPSYENMAKADLVCLLTYTVKRICVLVAVSNRMP